MHWLSRVIWIPHLEWHIGVDFFYISHYSRDLGNCGVFRGGAFVDGVDDELDAVGKSFGDNATITIFFEDSFGEFIGGVNLEGTTIEFMVGFLELEKDSIVVLSDGLEEVFPVERLIVGGFLRGFSGCWGWSLGVFGGDFAFWGVFSGFRGRFG